MANDNQVKQITTKPFVYKASSTDALRGYAKTSSSIWLREHDASTAAQKANRAASASKWLDQLLEATDLA